MSWDFPERFLNFTNYCRRVRLWLSIMLRRVNVTCLHREKLLRKSSVKLGLYEKRYPIRDFFPVCNTAHERDRYWWAPWLSCSHNLAFEPRAWRANRIQYSVNSRWTYQTMSSSNRNMRKDSGHTRVRAYAFFNFGNEGGIGILRSHGCDSAST